MLHGNICFQHIYEQSIISAAGGNTDGVYYEIIEFEKEDIKKSNAGKGEIWYYDYLTDTQKMVYQYDGDALYISGNEKYVVISDYRLDNEISGKILLVQKGMLYEIHLAEIVAGNDIIGSKIYGNKILIYSNSDFYIYDLSTNNIIHKKYKLTVSPDEFPYFTKICISDTGFGYLIQNESEIIFRYYPTKIEPGVSSLR